MNTEDRDLFPAEPEMTAQRRHRRRTSPGDAPAERPAETVPAGDPPAEALTEAPVKTPAAIPPEEAPAAEPGAEEADAPAEKAPETPSQAADSRVPAEARRMAAAPYGVRDAGARRPGTRPLVAPRRPAQPADEGRRSAARPRQPQRVEVGYAPGRMSEGMTRQIPAADEMRREPAARENGPADPYGRNDPAARQGSRSAREYLERRGQPLRGMREDNRPAKPAGKPLRLAIIGLLAVGAVLIVLLFLKGGGNPAAGTPRVISFTDSNPEGLIAPADVIFSVVTGKEVGELRLTDEDGQEVPVTLVAADNTDGKLWNITLHVEDGFDGTVRLEAREGENSEWLRTDYTAAVAVKSVPAATAPAGTEAAVSESPAQETETPRPQEAPAETAAAAAALPEGEGTDAGDEAAENAEADDEADGEWDEGDPVMEDGGSTEEAEGREAGELRTVPPTPTPAPEEVEQPTETPALTAEAAPEANPDLITNITIYTGNKKVKEYSRPAKEVIRMPVGAEYTTKEVGVLTFRGSNFRTNAACGTLPGPARELQVIWQEEGGSSRGVNQTYYGYGWPGQPAIVQWSKQIRASSNIYETKQEKEQLKEVILAGNDGAIRFLDLDDGSLTRNSIKLGYPLRGTPSLHPYFQPFMSVGQFARKMKVKTGKIGLRQYNLYNEKELKLIDGLDGKSHRPLNDIGSFQTSAVIDRTSDTLIVAGSNGVLYLEALNPSFDWKMGVLSISPSITMMTSKTKGQKAAQIAVESSLAVYDRYVYYADMGGVLRCVDTDTLRPVWAVETGDAVMASVALDLGEDRSLALYTANMLANRKKGDGNVQIRRFDALSGRELWCTDVGVYKGKKDKEDVGAKASPVIGEKGLSGLVFFTVTGLSEDGRTALGLHGEEKSALIALDKETGRRVWARGMESRSESSPVAVYDADGNGWIVQCQENGMIELLDGLTGTLTAALETEGQIEASPAVFNDMMVIGTTGKGTSFIYGIRISDGTAPDAEGEADAEAGVPEADAEPEGEGAEAEEAGEDPEAYGEEDVPGEEEWDGWDEAEYAEEEEANE